MMQTKSSLSALALAALLPVLVLALAGCAAPAAAPTEAAAATEEATAAPTEAAVEAPTAAAASAPDAAAAPAGAPAGPPPGGEMGVMPGATTFASVPPTVADLAYADQSAAQKLDLYIPTTGDGPFPVVIMIHGGGFMFGDKADGAGLTGVDQLLEAGYAVASINYRLSGEAQWPAQIHDAKAAVRYLRAVAAEYNLDPENFGAWGASAGGNLVALLGTTCGVA